MVLEQQPVKRVELPTDARLDEWRMMGEESRFAMTRYMQMLALYLAAMAVLFRERALAQALVSVAVIFCVGTAANVIVFYAARCFRSMAYHALDRQATLADSLGFQGPHPMIWGYRVGLVNVVAGQIALSTLALFRYVGA